MAPDISFRAISPEQFSGFRESPSFPLLFPDSLVEVAAYVQQDQKQAPSGTWVAQFRVDVRLGKSLGTKVSLMTPWRCGTCSGDRGSRRALICFSLARALGERLVTTEHGTVDGVVFAKHV